MPEDINKLKGPKLNELKQSLQVSLKKKKINKKAHGWIDLLQNSISQGRSNINIS